MQKPETSLITRDITEFVCNKPLTFEEEEEFDFDGGSILHLILWEKSIGTMIKDWSTCVVVVPCR